MLPSLPGNEQKFSSVSRCFKMLNKDTLSTYFSLTTSDAKPRHGAIRYPEDADEHVLSK